MLKRGIFYIKKSLQVNIWQKRTKITNKKKKSNTINQSFNHINTITL